MPRIARIVVSGFPYHVTQRGNRRQQTFFSNDDYEYYLNLLGTYSKSFGTEIWAYCLMPNHIHLLVMPTQEKGLRHTIAQTHEAYTKAINFKKGWSGHLWQGRFFSAPLDDQHVINTARYIEMNPVRANICAKPEDYLWSSARAHLGLQNDSLVKTERLLSVIADWGEFLNIEESNNTNDAIRQLTQTGRPIGSEAFVLDLERKTGVSLAPRKRGRRPKKSP